jgi:hypothetical protein
MTFFRTVCVTRGLEEYEVTVDFKVTYWGSPGTYWDPPEGMEMELGAVWIEPPPWAARHHPLGMPFALTTAEMLKIEEDIYMDPPEQDYGPDPDDERDRRYDEERF